MTRLAAGLLALSSLMLAGVIAWELQPSKAMPKTAPMVTPLLNPAGPPVSGGTPVATAADRGVWLDNLLARPVFSATRRPARPAPIVSQQAAPPALPRLAGIVIDGSRRSVIFAPEGDHRPVSVTEGGAFNGFRVDSIEIGQVTVTGFGGPQVLRPSFDPAAPASAPIVAARPIAPPPSFNGPPGLDRMFGQSPRPPNNPPANPLVAPGGGIPGLPTLNVNGMVAIPGLTTR